MSPAPLLLLLIATASATLAHVLWGKRWVQLLIFWMAAFAGCLIAFTIGVHVPLPFRTVAPAGVPVLETVIAAWGMMFIASRLRV
jgi:hypothetical protein